jgi:hypothetical protein
MPKKLQFLISYDVMQKYICAKKYMSQCTKICKYIYEMIEIIFNLYEICNIKHCESTWLK